MAEQKNHRVLLSFLAVILVVFLFLGIFVYNSWLLGNISAAELNSGELFFTILHTNDEHSGLLPHSPAIDFNPEEDNDTVGGFARLATAIEQVRDSKHDDNEPVMVFSGGDFLGGSAFGWLAPLGFAPELTLLQQMGYDAVVIGNHEYDFGEDVLVNYLTTAGYPDAHEKTVLLASNTSAPGHPLEEKGLFKNTHLMELDNGLKVGLFGLIGETAILFASSNIEYDINFSDQAEAALKSVEKLKQQGADIIIAITHSGVDEDIQLAREVEGINIIVGGHCHTALEEPVIEGETLIVQTGSRLNYLGMLEIAYNPETGKIRTRNGENNRPFLLPLDNRYPINPEIAASIDIYTKELNTLVSERTGGIVKTVMDTVAYSEFILPVDPPLQETPLGNFVADAMRFITWKKTGEKVDIAVQANGNIRGSIIPGSKDYSLNRIAFYDIAEQVGLGCGPGGDPGYPLVSFYLTGDEVLKVLEIAALLPELYGNEFFLQWSGLRFNYDPGRAVLFNIPFINIPLPSLRAVLNADIYTGDGIQPAEGNEGYSPLHKDDDKLYNIVTDTYILSYLPMAGEMLPQLEIVPKDRNGNPVDNLDEFILYDEGGNQLKVWQAVTEYAASQPRGISGYPEIPSYYGDTAGRVIFEKTVSLLAWPLLGLFAVVSLLYFFIRRKRLRKYTA